MCFKHSYEMALFWSRESAGLALSLRVLAAFVFPSQTHLMLTVTIAVVTIVRKAKSWLKAAKSTVDEWGRPIRKSHFVEPSISNVGFT